MSQKAWLWIRTLLYQSFWFLLSSTLSPPFWCMGCHYGMFELFSFIFIFSFIHYSYLNQLKGPDTDTLHKPPSHHLFNALNNSQVGQANALLEWCAHFNAQTAQPPVAPTMNFNLNIPAEVTTLLRPQAPPGPPPLAAVHTHAGPALDPGHVLQPLPVVSNSCQFLFRIWLHQWNISKAWWKWLCWFSHFRICKLGWNEGSRTQIWGDCSTQACYCKVVNCSQFLVALISVSFFL